MSGREGGQNFAKLISNFVNFSEIVVAVERTLRMSCSPTVRAASRQRASVGKISAKRCSFSAVSAPIFARKYAFDSIFQNLPDSQAEIFEI